MINFLVFFELALDGINKPIGVFSYKIKNYISEDILDKLSSEKYMNMHINID